ncbi:hypothetical protein [Qipengyuania sediminis]|uniref:hypothetical protein n=1 Tax=Qipengyuania sediminis TaxID=1532023 RepID=UPI00140470CF|nr:hypothetical protein [Qipengyuania sediminis]
MVRTDATRSRIAAAGHAIAFLALGGCNSKLAVLLQPNEEDKAQLASLNAEAYRANARVKLPFDPQRQSLVVEDNAFLGRVPASLVSQYGLPIAYTQPTIRTQVPTAFRLIDKALCDEISADPTMRASGIMIGMQVSSPEAASCVLSTEEALPASALRVSSKVEQVPSDTARGIYRVQIDVHSPAGQVYRLQHYVFGRDGSNDTSLADVVARAIGLAGPVQARNMVDREVVLKLVQARRQLTSAAAVAELETFLADGTGHARGEVGFELFARDPELLSPYADRLIAKLDEQQRLSRAQQGDQREKTGDLISILPSTEFNRLTAAILATLRTNPDHVDGVSERLVERLAGAGSSVLPLLGDMAADYRRVNRPPPYAHLNLACRVGLKAQAVVGDDYLHFWARANEPELRHRGNRAGQRRLHRKFDIHYAPNVSSYGAMLYITLRRIGLAKAAEAKAAHTQIRSFRERAGHVHPKSPPEVCTSALMA